MDASELPAEPAKFAATVSVGAKGQIVIPKGAREMFDIKPGDTLLLLADGEQGIAILRQDVFRRFVQQAMPQNSSPPRGTGTR